MLLSSLAIPLINISVMIFPVGGLSITSIIWMIHIFLYMVLVYFLAQNGKPNLTKYIWWTDSVHLTDTSHFLHGNFNFDSQSGIIPTDQYVVLR